VTTTLSTLIRLRAIQNKTRKLFEGMSDLHYRLQYHADLSPAGWYLGQGIFIENYWLHEVIQNKQKFTSDKSLFFADNCPLAERGPRIPAMKNMLLEMAEQQDNNDLLLMEKTPPLSDHPLFKDEYIENFIIQHYARHYESIHMVLNQIALKKHNKDKKNHPYQPDTPLKSQAMIKDMVHIKGGSYSVGGRWPFSIDNELPEHQVQLNDFCIAVTPVSNAQYLQFIEDGAYKNKALWSDTGWKWKNKNDIQHPEYWSQNSSGQWYGITYTGPAELNINDSVYGLSQYEASAFANWAGARLPHEHEWETAARLELIKGTTNVWEWCNNTLYAYEGYNSFPYEDKLTPKMNIHDYVLKGASQHTRHEIKRASYRNAYPAEQRHIFAGLRLVFK